MRCKDWLDRLAKHPNLPYFSHAIVKEKKKEKPSYFLYLSLANSIIAKSSKDLMCYKSSSYLYIYIYSGERDVEFEVWTCDAEFKVWTIDMWHCKRCYYQLLL